MTIIQRMDHFTVVTDQLDETRVFYERLGLVPGPRPEFGVGGLWLYAQNHPVLHVVAVSEMPALRRGALDHMAFHGDQIVPTLETLQRNGIAYRLLRLPRPWNAM
jgi:catechol 2,3-dioxygenase-like lactoylglutathione lyase family enzyme